MVTKLTLEYDGSEFAGWARQPGVRTVQEELERALRTVLGERGHDGEPLTLTVAGRTDRGVHAWGQVASYAHEAVDPLRLNALLADDIAVLAAEPARRGLRRAPRRAQPHLLLSRARPPRAQRVRARRALWWPRRWTATRCTQCAAALRGDHDFTAFTPTETEHTRFGATCFAPSGDATGDLLEFWIEADTFLRHMNRVLVGTMLEVAARAAHASRSSAPARGPPARQAGRPRPRTGWRSPSVVATPSGMAALGDRCGVRGDRGCPYAGKRDAERAAHQRRRDRGRGAAGAAPRAGRRSPGVRLAVIAPDGNRSAMARSITTRRPLWVEEVAVLRRHRRLRDRRHARRLRAPGEPRPGRGLPGRARRLRHQPRREPRRRHHLLGHRRRGARGRRARAAGDRRLPAVAARGRSTTASTAASASTSPRLRRAAGRAHRGRAAAGEHAAERQRARGRARAASRSRASASASTATS